MILPNWHPIFVHFTIALLATSVVLFATARYWKGADRKQRFEQAARLILYAGITLTLVTVAAGFYAYFTVDHDDPSHAVMKVHRNLALATTLIFAAIAWVIRRGDHKSPSNVIMASMVLALALLGATGWYGGELVYRHGIGVMSLPTVSGEGHDHGEGAGHEEPKVNSEPENGPEQISDNLHHALKSGDVQTVKSLLAPDVLILEGDHAQRDRFEYMSGHMVSDMAFLPNVTREVLEREVGNSGDLAWVVTRSRMKGEYKDQVIDLETRELLIMKYDGQKWQITLIHWGS